MKKILSLILAALICFAAASCETTESSSKNRASKTSSSSSRRTAEPTQTPETKYTAEPFYTPEPSVNPTMPPPKNDADDYYLVGINPPYELHNCETYLKINDESFQMAGQDCSNGIVLSGVIDSYALINLNGKYSTLDFDIGHIDGSAMRDDTITFFIDGIENQTIVVNSEVLPYHVSLDLNYGSILKIMKSSSAKLGFESGAEIGLSEMVAK